MPAESYGSGEATGFRRKYLVASLILGVAIVIAALVTGRPAGALVGIVVGLASTLRYLSIRGKGIDPSKSAIQRVREGDTRKYGRPF
jgi:hypothetical protein